MEFSEAKTFTWWVQNIYFFFFYEHAYLREIMPLSINAGYGVSQCSCFFYKFTRITSNAFQKFLAQVEK